MLHKHVDSYISIESIHSTAARSCRASRREQKQSQLRWGKNVHRTFANLENPKNSIKNRTNPFSRSQGKKCVERIIPLLSDMSAAPEISTCLSPLTSHVEMHRNRVCT